MDEIEKRNNRVIGAYLFESYVNGKADEWSDIDVAIVTDSFIGNSFDFKFFLMKIARDRDVNIEPHPFTVEEFTKDNPLVSEILRTGERVA
ncbi:MAG TPA: nucleotidyltransferase [Candidatus Atribacteria bacterium]|nr:nucleotidyltransferase [Candidatus Atribacteria bacterium]